MAAVGAGAAALSLGKPALSSGVTAIPIAPAWEGAGARAGLPAHGGALICMLVKLTSNDNPNYVCLVYYEGYISD